MAKLLLVKHALPVIDAARPSHEWPLSDEGRARCVWLGQQWRTHGVERVHASREPKALETARLASAEIGIRAVPRDGLHENDRTDLGFLPREQLERRIRSFFTDPARISMGCESAQTALRRFESAVRESVREAGGTVAIVAHGTVITLLVAAHNDVNAFELWTLLGLPSYVVLDRETFAWDRVVINPP